jgi:hypothetical protein
MFVREQGLPAQNVCLSGPGCCVPGREAQGLTTVPDFEQMANYEFKILNLLDLSPSVQGGQPKLCPILNRWPL